MFCSMECNRRDFCGAWCLVNFECMLTNFLISPQDGPDTDKVECYSHRRPGNLILKAMFHMEEWLPISHEESTILIGKRHRLACFRIPCHTCCLSWVRTIQLHLGDQLRDLPSGQTEIRLGTTMPGGPTDFSQLDLIGTIDNPPKKAKFMAILERDQTNLS